MNTQLVAGSERTQYSQHGITYCRREMKGKGRPARTSPKWCECGHKRHGANHDEGSHHKLGMHKK
jgi:hypothetical protein